MLLWEGTGHLDALAPWPPAPAEVGAAQQLLREVQWASVMPSAWAHSTPTTQSYKAAACLQGAPGVRRDGWGGEPPLGLCSRRTPDL